MIHWLLSAQTWLNPQPNMFVWHVLGIVLLINTLVNMICGFILFAFFHQKTHKINVGSTLGLIFLASLLPIAGAIIVLSVSVLARFYVVRPEYRVPDSLFIDETILNIRPRVGSYSAGGIISRLNMHKGPTEESMQALMHLAVRKDAETTQLIECAMIHENEIIRLLAHHLLEQREKGIVRFIQILESGNKEGEGPPTERVIWLDLAQLHLEFIYLGFSGESLRKLHLDAAMNALAHLDSLPTHPPSIPRYALVQARLAQLNRETPVDDVIKSYQSALALGAAPARGLPYLLEDAWERKDYLEITRLMDAYPVFTQLPKIGPIVSSWRRASV